MINILDFIKNNKYNLFLVITWLIITIITMLHHELWRDEAQVWCLVRDLDIVNLIKAIHIEGHPYLWYLLNLPFVKMGCSVIAMQIIGLFFVFLAVLLVVFKSPFGKVMKFLIIFNAGMLYLLPIVVRNYALIPFFMFYIAHIYHDRHSKPYLYLFLIFCLSQTHSLMLCLIISLLLFFIYERLFIYKIKKDYILLFLIFLSFVLIFCNLYSYFFYLNENVIILNSIAKNNDFNFLLLFNKFIDSFFMKQIIEYTYNFYIIIKIFFIFLFVIFVHFMFFINKKICLLFILNLLYLFCIYSAIWNGGFHLQKSFLLVLLCIFSYWIVYKNINSQLKLFNISLYCILLLFFSYSPFFIFNEYFYNFSNGKTVADYITKNINEIENILFIGDDFLATPVSCYFKGKKLYNIEKKAFFSYFDFEKDFLRQYAKIPENNIYVLVSENYDYNSKKLITFDNTFYPISSNLEHYSIFYLKQN